MPHWNDTDLTRVGAAEELDLESERADGTLRDRVTMWVVRVDDPVHTPLAAVRAGGSEAGEQVQALGAG